MKYTASCKLSVLAMTRHFLYDYLTIKSRIDQGLLSAETSPGMTGSVLQCSFAVLIENVHVDFVEIVDIHQLLLKGIILPR